MKPDTALEQILAGQSLGPEALFALGNDLHRKGNLEDSVVCYQMAIASAPESVPVRNNLAIALMALGQLDAAAESLRQALHMKPDYAEAHNNLGVVYKRQKKLDDAIACYRLALELSPGYAKAMLNLGSAYLLKKDYEQALTWSRASLAADPEQVEANQNIAAIMLEAGHFEEARHYRDQAYRRQAVFIDRAVAPVRSVLLLWSATKGNVPIEFLLPAGHNTCITWMIEYATEDQVRSLPDYNLVFNAIGDPDAAAPAADRIADFLRTCPKPVLNVPGAVARTSRDRIPALLASIDRALVPSTLRIEPKVLDDRRAALPGLRMPVLLRPSGSHGGDHLVKIESGDDLAALALWNAQHYYATRFYDFRSADGHYRKYRIVFVDRVPYPYHLAVGDHWLVHYETAGMLDELWKRSEEARFLENPSKAIGTQAMAAVTAIGKKIDLDYCGLDFSVLPDGRVLVFEANATMLVHPEDDPVLGYKNPFVQHILDAFEALLVRIAGDRA